MARVKQATAFASTLGICVLAFGGPGLASTGEESTSANGDGQLSDDELAALAAIPVDEVTAGDLADVREVDLARLPQALQDRIRQPVDLRYTEVEPTGGSVARTLAGDPTKQVRGQWWHENAYGWHLSDYYIAVSFSYNGTKVIEASDWSWGNGHWGYQFCGEDARGWRWVNSSHTHYQAFGRGRFGPPSCAVTTMTNGGTVNVNGRGDGWLS
jgi:hypothetical protein